MKTLALAIALLGAVNAAGAANFELDLAEAYKSLEHQSYTVEARTAGFEAPGKAGPAEGVYFQRDDPKPWQNCYTLAPQDAFARIKAGNFKGAGLLQISAIRLDGEVVRVSHLDYSGASREIAFGRCPFEETDKKILLSCDVTVQNVRPTGQIDDFSYLQRIETEWRKLDQNARVIDCRAGVAYPVRNSWAQTFTLADYKLIRHINNLGLPLVPSTSFGTVSRGTGLNRLQNWRATVGFQFMENRMQPEICDASVEELSIPENLESWVKTRNGAWCPWGLEVVSLSCQGLPRVESSTAHSSISLPHGAPEIDAHCAK
mgnify:CR=1 FL=1